MSFFWSAKNATKSLPYRFRFCQSFATRVDFQALPARVASTAFIQLRRSASVSDVDALNPRQLPNTKGIPCCVRVFPLIEASGFADESASTRNVPAFTYAANSDVPETPATVCLPRTEVVTSPPPA